MASIQAYGRAQRFSCGYAMGSPIWDRARLWTTWMVVDTLIIAGWTTALLSLRTYNSQKGTVALSSSYSSVVKLKPLMATFLDQVFDIPRQLYIDDDEAMEFLLYIFLRRVQIGESFRYAIIDEALGFAHSLVNDVTHAGKEILRILVDIVVRTLQRPDESVKEAIARASRECGEATIRDGQFAPGKGRKELMEAHGIRMGKSLKAQGEAVGGSTQSNNVEAVPVQE